MRAAGGYGFLKHAICGAYAAAAAGAATSIKCRNFLKSLLWLAGQSRWRARARRESAKISSMRWMRRAGCTELGYAPLRLAEHPASHANGI